MATVLAFISGVAGASFCWLLFAWYWGSRAEERERQERRQRYAEYLQSSKETEEVAY